MNWLKRFLGLYDRKQAKRTQEVSAYVHEKKSKYTEDMLRLQLQAKKVHHKTRQAHQEAVKLKEIVDDVSHRVAIATSNGRH